MTPIEIQVRRQLWWTVVAIDAQVAFASSLPPLIDTRQHNVEPVTEPGETARDPISSTPNHAFRSILGIFAGGKNKFYNDASEFLHILHNNRLRKEDVDNILSIAKRIQNDVEARKGQIDAVQNTSASQIPTDGNDSDRSLYQESSPIFGQFTKTILSMLAAKPYPIMYPSLKRHNLLPYLREREPE
jgi:hypothetical protein